MFDNLWREINAMPKGVVQEYNELEHVFNIMRECNSYLEVGSAEGKSLYVIAHSNPEMEITYIDLGEAHTTPIRDENVAKLPNKIVPILGDSNSIYSWEKVRDKKFDAVLIDAGHDLFSVLVDACLYAPLATKYVFFHDIMIPDVNRVFEWYAAKMNKGRSYRVVNSGTYGFGVIAL